MRNKNLHTLLVFSFLFIICSSCSKDKKLEKTITNDSGVWNIDQVDYDIVATLPIPDISQGTAYNVGTFTFKSSGQGSYEYSITTNMTTHELSSSFLWQVEDGDITITQVEQTMDLANLKIKQHVVAMDGEETSPDKISLEGSETLQEFGTAVEQFVLVGNFYLSK